VEDIEEENTLLKDKIKWLEELAVRVMVLVLFEVLLLFCDV